MVSISNFTRRIANCGNMLQILLTPITLISCVCFSELIWIRLYRRPISLPSPARDKCERRKRPYPPECLAAATSGRAVAFLFIEIAVAQQWRTMSGVQEFIVRYPGVTPPSRAVYSGFPLWLRLLHFFNLFSMMFIICAGIQILADHPRLSWRRDCTPGTEWFRFQHEVPKDRVWTSKDDAVTIPKWLGIPGVRHSIGFARWW